MKFKDVKIGKCYLLDAENKYQRIDTDMIGIKVVDKKKGFLSNNIIGHPILPRDGIMENQIAVCEENLKEMSENPLENVIIRYPADIPVFSVEDALVLANMSSFVLKNATEANLNEGDMIKISTLVQKVKFYAEIADRYSI